MSWKVPVTLGIIVALGTALFIRRHSAEPATSALHSAEALTPSAAASPVLQQPEQRTIPAAVLSAVPPPNAADEGTLMTELRRLQASDPAAALELARVGNQRFPRSADAPERSAVMVDALIALDRYGEARAEAEAFQARYPDSEWARHVECRTGAHRHDDARRW